MGAMQHRPIGALTFLFTDMEGSSRAWESYPSETEAALQRHDQIVAREVEAHDGAIILERGEGDSVFAVKHYRKVDRPLRGRCYDVQASPSNV
jgi:class 3 adenylate cyclase